MGMLAIGDQTIRNWKWNWREDLIEYRLVQYRLWFFALCNQPGFECIIQQHQVKTSGLSYNFELLFDGNTVTANRGTSGLNIESRTGVPNPRGVNRDKLSAGPDPKSWFLILFSGFGDNHGANSGVLSGRTGYFYAAADLLAVLVFVFHRDITISS